MSSAAELSDRIATVLADRWDTAFVDPIRSKHGTLHRYRRWGCRCDECRRATRDHRRRTRAKAKARQQAA